MYNKERHGKSKGKAYSKFQMWMDIKEGEKDLYWLTGVRDRAGKDVQ